MIVSLLLAAQLALSLPARPTADDRPLMLPTRDVDVTYEVARPDRDGKISAATQRTRWAVAAGMGRIDPPIPGFYAIVDQRAHRLLVVRDADRTVLETPLSQATTMNGIAEDGFFQRLGDTTVAGIPCTEWNMMDSSENPETVCFSADGVLLRARHDRAVFVVATQVVYTTADPSIFSVPSGYRVVQTKP